MGEIPRSERIANRAVRGMGSVAFIVIQTVVIVLWITLNGWLLASHAFDRFPFILLNLLFSTQAAYAAPLILLAQNRQADRDAARDNRAAAEVDEIDDLDKESLEILREMRVHMATHTEELRLLRTLQDQAST